MFLPASACSCAAKSHYDLSTCAHQPKFNESSRGARNELLLLSWLQFALYWLGIRVVHSRCIPASWTRTKRTTRLELLRSLVSSYIRSHPRTCLARPDSGAGSAFWP